VALAQLWRYVLVITGLNILSVPFYSVVTGLQRMDLSTISGVFSTLCSALLTVGLLWLGWGLQGLLIASLLTTFLTLLLFVWMVHRLLPKVSLNPLNSRWVELKGILTFSLKLYFTQMAVAIQNQVEKLYLARFVGVVPVGWYNIASDVGLKARRVPELLLTPVMAAASELDARGEERRVRELHDRSHKYLAFVGVPLVVYVLPVSGRFVDLWLGPALHVVALPLAALVFANFLNSVTGPGFLILVGRGLLNPGVKSALTGLFLNITLSFALIYEFGFSGAVIGVFTTMVATTVLFLFWFYRATGYPLGRILRRAYLKPTVCAVAVLGILVAIAPPRQLGWLGLCIQGMVFSVLYVLVLLRCRFFDLFDLAQVESFLPLARLARRIMPAV
jgi:O-antigen/teichoic acid export membrane protein